MESKKYIMLIDSNDNHIVYDKKEKRVKAISNYFYFPSWGNFSFTFSKAGQIENEILLYYWSSDFAIFHRDHNQNKNFNNKEFETKFRYILNNIHSSEENPILFLFKLQS